MSIKSTVCAITMFSLTDCNTVNNFLSADSIDYKNKICMSQLQMPIDLEAMLLNQRYGIPYITKNLGNQLSLEIIVGSNTIKSISAPQNFNERHASIRTRRVSNRDKRPP
ncbi:hypothetical protein MYVALT_F_02550 [Candidatus Vallotia tarda]|uniref:Uncharacterized protein n=1 Tax=Candidatus Vallotiella hemipterorum TaxID=1177213 RepID=A0A916NV02_9BURK|nr:hypothetical protein MYVALT_F_02550 [Candidatus Vallotia tarda]